MIPKDKIDKAKKILEINQKIKSFGTAFIAKKIDDVEEEIGSLTKIVTDYIESVPFPQDGIDGVQGEKGEKGDRGEQGLHGMKGDKGDKGERGEKGEKGEDGFGIDGKDGKNGIDGKDGSPDTGEDIVVKLNTLEKVLDRKVIKGLETFVDQSNLDRAISILDQRTQFLLSKRTAPDPVATAWGTITGTLSDQTDLQAALDAKGTVTSVAALTLGTTGTDLSSTVATGTTTPVITLNVPTASAANRGALSSTDWSTFNAKESPLTFSTGLTRTTNTITANLSTGIAGGQSAIGGTGTGDSLILKSTNGVGTSSSWIKGQVGNNGAIETSRQGVADSPDASGSGGTVTTSGGYTIHTFTTSGTFIVSGGTLSVDYLVVAGGGGGGGTDGGGGGAGGMKTGTGFSVAAGSYSITVGAGGTGGTGAGKGTNGGDSIFSTITSTGGGGGGVYNNQTGLNGGSGGGGGANGGGSTAGGTGTAGQGNNGGSGKGPTNYAGAGGGGAGAVGGDAAATGSAGGGNGGAGSASSISGSSVTYAGGGGGGTYLGTAGAGGSGGGGAGTNVNSGTGTAGTVNTGGGGGGGGDTVGTGGAGGSGIVIIRYLTPTTTQRPVMGVNKTSPTAQLHIGAGVGNPYSAPLKFTSGTLLSAPEVGANEFLTDLYYKTITTGTVRGVSPVILTGRLTGKTSAQSTVVTYTPTEDSSFDISANVLVTTSTVHSFSVTCAYTDEGNTARTLTLGFTLVAGGTILTLVENANGAVPYMGIVQSIRAKANTAITITTTGTFTTVTYNVEAFITRKS